MERIYRLHYRAQLKDAYDGKALAGEVESCTENIRELQREGKVLTAALYYHEKMLFLYYEAVGEPLKVTEPLLAGNGGEIIESGEEIQADVASPMQFLDSLSPYLQIWPGQKADRLWVYMYPIYYHSIPKDPEDWRRAAVPAKRRGRIAFLREGKLFSYTYYHRAIVEEGLLTGDKYQSIALHENILFSYFEEPKTVTNVRNQPEKESQVIKEWIAADPEAHFIHMPQGGGENFMFLPELFALGVEDQGMEE